MTVMRRYPLEFEMLLSVSIKISMAKMDKFLSDLRTANYKVRCNADGDIFVKHNGEEVHIAFSTKNGNWIYPANFARFNG